MHGLRQIADCGGAHRHILDQAQQAHTILGGHGSHTLEVLLDVSVGCRVAVIRLGRLGYHDAAGQILCQTSDLIREAGDVLLADVCQQQVDQVVAALGLGALRRACNAAAVQGFVQVGHLDELVLDMRSLGRARHLTCQRGSADEHIANADLAAAVGLTVIAREALYHHAGKLNFAVEEDHIVRDEYTVENNQNLVTAVNLVADVDVVMFLGLAGVTGLTAQNQGDAFRVGRARKGNGVVLVALTHGDSRHNQNIMAVQVAGLVCLRAGNVNAVRGALDNVQEQIRIRLLGRRQTAVALNVGHRAVNTPVIVLYIGPELDEILVVLGAASLVGLKGGGVNRVRGIHADTTLEARCGLLTEQALHLYLFDEVVGGLMQMGKTVYLLAGQVGRCRHQIFVLRVLCQLVRCRKRVERRTNDRVVHYVFNLLAEAVQVEVQPPQRVDVLVFCHHNIIFLVLFLSLQ